MDFFDFANDGEPADLEDKDFLFEAFCKFGTLQVETWDIDPTYPVLKRIYDMEDLSENDRVWRTFLYVCLYNIGSAYRVWDKYPSPCLPDLETLRQPTGIERRGFRQRPDLVQKHITAALKASGGDFAGWVRGYGSGEAGWNNARDAMRALPWGGNWSAYKWADLLAVTHGLPFEAPDFGVGSGGKTAGPIPGMVTLTGHDWKRCATDIDLQKALFKKCAKAGVPFRGLDQVETSLCDFNSLCKGRFYAGHDIDSQMEHFKSGSVPDSFWEARSVFPDNYRGEKNDWFGVDKSLKRRFVDYSEVDVRGNDA